MIKICAFAKMLTLVFLLSCALPSNVTADEHLKPEQVLAKHLESLGAAEKRAAVRTRVISGNCRFSYRTRGTGYAEGKAVIASEGIKSLFGMSFQSPEYPQERIGFDGKNITTGYLRTGARTMLGNFLLTYQGAVREGLLGGTLSSAWPLLDVAARNPKMAYEGTKTINGKEAIVLSYNPRKGSDLNIKLYFESATFRHIRTEYERVISPQVGSTPDASTKQSASRHRMVEDFSDFKREGDLTLPHTYRLQVSIAGQTETVNYEWAFTLTQFDFNQPLDPNSFVMEAFKSGS